MKKGVKKECVTCGKTIYIFPSRINKTKYCSKECHKNDPKKKKRIKRGPYKQFCPQGHDTFICGRTYNGFCRDCSRILAKKHREKKLAEYKERSKQWYWNNKEKANALRKQWALDNPEKQKAYSKEYQRINRDIINYIKKDRPCMDCNVIYPLYVMQFDHRPGEKKLFVIGSHCSNRSPESIILEITKCDLVCSNCHCIRTYMRKHPNEFAESKSTEKFSL